MIPPLKPYLVRAVYDWCFENGLTPYLTVAVDEHTLVPRQYVREGLITLNVSDSATQNFFMDDSWVSFDARFGGVAQHLEVPMERVVRIFARENNQGLGFVLEEPAAQEEEFGEEPPQLGLVAEEPGEAPESTEETPPDRPPKGGRPSLRIVK